MKLGMILFAVAITASAAERVNNLGFYAARAHQIFKDGDAKEFHGGNVQGDDVQYLTWKGLISGKQLYLEVHGERLRIKVGKKWTVLSFRKAPALPGSDQSSVDLDDIRPDLYVKSAKDERQSVMCLESLGREYIHPRPYWEVYVITDPLGSPWLYRISGINASCRGIERAPTGTLLVPSWSIQKNVSPGVVVKYYAIEKNRFRKTQIGVTGSIESEYADKYLFDDAR